jgi:voltage-gated sodium channel
VYDRPCDDNDAAVSSGAPQVSWAARIVASPIFTGVIVTTILVNAVVLGLHTYEEIDERWGTTLDVINGACLTIFIVELLIRIAAYWPRPLAFFRDGWNVFDFIVIGAAFVPGIRENSTLLRLARLARVVRIVRLLPELRVLLAGVWRSVPPLASIGAVTLMVLFVYGMVGWILFSDELPEQWGNIGRAMLTLFVMLTLEDFPAYMDAAMEIEPWAWVYFVSFILVAAFIVLNVLIGIVLNSMEEARELERRRVLREAYGGATGPVLDPDAHAHVVERIAILRSALEDLEVQLAVGDPAGEGRRPP